MFFRKKFRKRRGRFQQKKQFSRWPRFSLGNEAKQGVWILILLLGVFATAVSFLGRAGEVGFHINTALVLILGDGKWSLPILFSLIAISLTKDKKKNFDSANIIGLFLFLICSSSLLYFYYFTSGGGLLGQLVAQWSIDYIGSLISAVLFSIGLIISLLLLLDTSLSNLFGKESILFKVLTVVLRIIFYPFIRKGFDDENDDEDYREDEEDSEEEHEDEKTRSGKAVVREYSSYAEASEGKEVDDKDSKPAIWSKSNIKMNIPIDLLKSKPRKPTSGNIDRNQDVIKRTLLDFGIPVSMGEVCVGPTVTQYTFKPSKGISVSRVKALSDDLALNLAVHPVRIEAPIPGRPLVGLEVPNQTKVMVSLKEVIQSKQFKQRKSNMLLPLGRDVSGQIWLDDLAKMPHLLVAGATGSGKSVGLHSFITTLLYQNDPDDLKMILIDVKQVELTAYNGMPYLVAPVVTDNKRAVRSLQWCLSEMDRRLEKLKDAGCQNIQDYNKTKNRMPYLIVVIDELGDLLSTAKKEVEGAIIRLGQKARAAGIHLILATQRPSVDILSGLIKANMPARIAFSVTSSINSKTILDFTGAEKLLGQGDMLYINSSLPKPVRIQGTYISKDEIKSVVNYTKKKAGKAKYVKEITEKAQNQFNFEPEEVDDELLSEAKELIFNSGKASATMLQSRLSIGYPRANRILDILEKQGIVGPSIQNKPREVHMSEVQD